MQWKKKIQNYIEIAHSYKAKWDRVEKTKFFQLNQLERERGSRMADANNKKKMQLEAEIHRLNQEKRQVSRECRSFS